MNNLTKARQLTNKAALMLVFCSAFGITTFAQRDRGQSRESSRRPGGTENRISRPESIRQQTPGSFNRQQPASANNSARFDSRRNQPNRNTAGNLNRSGIDRYPSSPAYNNSNRESLNRNNPANNRNLSNRPGNSVTRPGTLNNRPGYGNRPGYNNNRPGYNNYNNRSYNSYNNSRRPVYSAYNPSWRYAHMPRRYSIFNTVPSFYLNLSFGGSHYRYYDGIYYQPYNNHFRVIAPPVGIFINSLPLGYRRIYVRDYPYYYYNGTYYDQRDNYYTVVSPPVGAVVESIPDGYKTITIDGETFYEVDGAQYKPSVQENGEIWYEVIKSN